MSESTISILTAPRTIEGLVKETPFQLRQLIGKLGGLESPEHKMAWHALGTQDARAKHILGFIQAWDAANPGAAAPAATTNGTHTPAVPLQQQAMTAAAPSAAAYQPPALQLQPMGGGPVPMTPVVDPAALQAATAATAGEAKGASRRNPKTSAPAAEAPPADLAAAVLDQLKTIVGGMAADHDRFAVMEKSVTALLAEATGTKSSRLEVLEKNQLAVGEVLKTISSALQATTQLQIWTLMAFLSFMENSMGASRIDLLQAAIQDGEMFQQLVDKATGKA